WWEVGGEVVMLVWVYRDDKVVVRSIKKSFVSFNHEAPSPLMRLGAFAIVAEERGFLKLSRALKLITQRRFFCGGSLPLSGRVIHLDGDSLILEPHSSGHHVPLPYCAYAIDCRWSLKIVVRRRLPCDPPIGVIHAIFVPAD